MPHPDEEWEVQPLDPDDTLPNERTIISSEGGEVCTILLDGLADKAVERMERNARRIAACPDMVRALGEIRRMAEYSDLLAPIFTLADTALKKGAKPDGLGAPTND